MNTAQPGHGLPDRRRNRFSMFAGPAPGLQFLVDRFDLRLELFRYVFHLGCDFTRPRLPPWHTTDHALLPKDHETAFYHDALLARAALPHGHALLPPLPGAAILPGGHGAVLCGGKRILWHLLGKRRTHPGNLDSSCSPHVPVSRRQPDYLPDPGHSFDGFGLRITSSRTGSHAARTSGCRRSKLTRR